MWWGLWALVLALFFIGVLIAEVKGANEVSIPFKFALFIWFVFVGMVLLVLTLED